MNIHLLIDCVGWTLLHFIWQGALIGCATALALALLRKAHPGHRYAFACTGLLACLLWPAADLVLRLQDGNMVTAQMRHADAMLVNGVERASGGVLTMLQSQLSLIVAFWAVCAALLALRMALGLLWIRRTSSAQRSDAHWQTAASRLAVKFGINRPVRLRVVDDLASPLTAGWLRPVVLLPASLVSGMPAELLEALLAHEMAHVKRLDYLVNLGQNLVETLLFYHPAVWWISGRIRIEREQIADDLSAQHTGEPRRLAQALSELERFQFAGHHLAMAANGGDLLLRVKRLVRPDAQALNWKVGVPVFALAAACVSVYAHASVRATAMERLIADRPPIADFSSCAKPKWPMADLAAEHTGTVTLGFKIDTDGKVIGSTVRNSSGYPRLDEAARDGIMLCKFVPGISQGKPVATWMKMQYMWALK